MPERPAVPKKKLGDHLLRGAIRALHLRFGLTPNQLTWASFWVSVAAAGLVAAHHLVWGLIAMAVGQILDGLDGGIAREFGLMSPEGRTLDTRLDRVAETLIFVGFAVGGFASWRMVLLALAAIYLLTTIVERSGFDPGAKRVVLYLGLLVPYRWVFLAIFAVNLAGYVVGLLIIDCRFQTTMDALGGDLDTVASRAASLEAPGAADG
jgi:phosphatidylglycerophosphate synthase